MDRHISVDPTREKEYDPLEEFFLYGNPNPDRLGCPGSEVIRGLARKELPIGHPARKHLGECSPCFREFRSLLPKENRLHGWTAKRKLTIAAAAAAAVLVVSVLGIQIEKSGAGRIEGDAIMNFATSGNRGISDSAVPLNPEVQSYQRQRLLLTVNLPPGSDDGDYELEILPDDGGASLAHVKGRASVGNGLTMFRARVDLSKVAPGLYKARVRRLSPASSGLPDGSWRSLTIHVR